MLRTILKEKRDDLNKQLWKRKAWWSRQPLVSLISITPKLSEEEPLWSRDVKNLSTLKLNGFSVKELNEEFYAYWAKAAWKRWLLSLFATPSYQRVAAWSYLQDCLAFQKIGQLRLLEDASESTLQVNEQILIDNLGRWFAKQDKNFKQSLRNRSSRWLEKHFQKKLKHYEEILTEKFLKQLEERLRNFPGDDNQKKQAYDLAVRNYSKAQEIIHLLNMEWCHNMCALFSPILYTYPTHEAGLISQAFNIPPTIAKIADSPDRPVINSEDNLSQLNVNAWVKGKRTQVEKLFKQPESQERDEQIKRLMDSSLNTLKAYVRPSLDFYSSIVQAVQSRHMEPDIALERLKETKSNLCVYFKQGNLLFHPDRFREANRELLAYWNDLFVSYRAFSNESIESLKKCDALIEASLLDKQSHRSILREHEEAMLELKKLGKKLDRMEENLEKWKKWMNASFEEMEAKLEQDKEEMEAKLEQDKEEMEAKLEQDKEEMEVKRTEWKEEMEAQIQLQIQLQLQKVMPRLLSENNGLFEKQQAGPSR